MSQQEGQQEGQNPGKEAEKVKKLYEKNLGLLKQMKVMTPGGGSFANDANSGTSGASLSNTNASFLASFNIASFALMLIIKNACVACNLAFSNIN